ncbi:uncharacterized protein LOC121043738 [Herpailurus yagouaroundi]|uniref:uncharacterized protein LOC121043738 n=1 Tax=Herpailurus yagouaroundi TaxID=1608482 RepID=UPI001AD6D969|nr:uncharacterized protein LOC121043738 [Puma yagouaroundi]
MDLSSSFFNACLRSKKGEKRYADSCWSGTWARCPTSRDPPKVAVLRNLTLERPLTPAPGTASFASGLGFLPELSAPGTRAGRAIPRRRESASCATPTWSGRWRPPFLRSSAPAPWSRPLTFSTSPKSRGVKCTQRGFISASLPQLCHPHSLLLGPGVCPPSQIFHFPATWTASSERTRDFAGVDSRSLPCHLNCKRQGAPLECTEVCPNRPAFNKWTSGVWSEENSHLLTFLPVFWQQLKGSCLLGLSRPRRGNFGVETHASHTDNQWNTSTHADTRTSPAKTHTRLFPSIGHLPPPQASTTPPPLSSPPGVPSSQAPGKAAALSQQMARGRSWDLRIALTHQTSSVRGENSHQQLL